MAIAGTEWRLFSVAMISLCCYNLLSLALPKLQGAILDAVVRDKSAKFDRNVELYLFVSLGVGMLGGIQSLCFSVVGRKIAKTIRLQLFRGIIIQVNVCAVYTEGVLAYTLSFWLTNSYLCVLLLVFVVRMWRFLTEIAADSSPRDLPVTLVLW